MSKAKWYVVWTRTGQEERVNKFAQGVQGVIETLLPIRELPYRVKGEWETRRSVLIPGYVFIKCVMDNTVFYPIYKRDEVIGWLGPDSMWPTDVPDDEIERVKLLAQGCDPSQILTEVTIDKRKRRGKGTLELGGTKQTITFGLNDKQPDEARVDECPDANEGDQTPPDIA